MPEAVRRESAVIAARIAGSDVCVKAVWVLVVLAAVLAVGDRSDGASADTGVRQPVVLTPARGQPAPASLTRSKAIPQVADAVIEARRRAPIPGQITPTLAALRRENVKVDYDIPKGCEPSFGPGLTSSVCRLGDPSSKRVIVVFGDSHAQMWTPALVAIAAQQRFALVPMVKPGCLISVLSENRARWPCHSWFEWALAKTRALHPVATLVSFLFSELSTTSSIDTATEDLRSVLAAVPRPVLLADPPGQSHMPTTCLASAAANMHNCSSSVPDSYRYLIGQLGDVARAGGYPVIPTEQWFCADGVCPMVVGGTVTTHNLDHLTPEYSGALGSLLGPELKRVERRL
jgi:SGNH domain (fused to AT3 domains)